MEENNNEELIQNDHIIPVKIEEEMKTSYIDYSMSVIVSRALPDVRDGFKPVHRRVLFGMNELGNTSDKPTKKSARIVGEVMGKYHPHGDSSIYGTLVRMAQPWAMRYCLVDGQGNFGSVDGDGAAAMRYTEARLSKLAEEMLRDIDKDTVDMQLNFDDSLREPVVLPCRFPNMIMYRLRPNRLSSLQMMRSFLPTRRRSLPKRLLLKGRVPETVSSIQPSMRRFCRRQNCSISKRWFSTVCLSLLTRIYP